MPKTEAQLRSIHKYDAKAYDKTLIRFKKGELDEIRTHAQKLGESLNGYITSATLRRMEAEGVKFSRPDA
jgi:hypothetical protein